MAGVKQNSARAEALEEWHRDGGIMIIGYEMLRNLSQGSRCRNRKQKAIFAKTLIDPGKSVFVVVGGGGGGGCGGKQERRMRTKKKTEPGRRGGSLEGLAMNSFMFYCLC